MSAFTTTILQAITIGIGIAISYFFNKSSLKMWRVFVGFFIGFTLSWLIGVFIWAFVFMSENPDAAIVIGMPKSMLFAVAGGCIGVYLGRRNAKLQIPDKPKTIN